MFVLLERQISFMKFFGEAFREEVRQLTFCKKGWLFIGFCTHFFIERLNFFGQAFGYLSWRTISGLK